MITKSQKRVLVAICEYVACFGYPPTLQEICSVLGLRSTNGAAEHVAQLEKKGYLRRERGDKVQARNIVILCNQPNCWPMVIKTDSGIELHKIKFKAA